MEVGATNIGSGQPATTVVRLGTQAGRAGNRGIAIDRREPRAISSILPQVLARYGVSAGPWESKPARQLDLFA